MFAPFDPWVLPAETAESLVPFYPKPDCIKELPGTSWRESLVRFWTYFDENGNSVSGSRLRTPCCITSVCFMNHSQARFWLEIKIGRFDIAIACMGCREWYEVVTPTADIEEVLKNPDLHLCRTDPASTTANRERAGLPPKIRFEVLQRDGFKCKYCGATAQESRLEVDHIIPRSKGGTDDINNLVTACFNCNRGKSDTDVI